MQIDTQCVASIVLTVYVYIQELPEMCSSLHVKHTHDNGGSLTLNLPTDDIIMGDSLPQPQTKLVLWFSILSILFSPFSCIPEAKKKSAYTCVHAPTCILYFLSCMVYFLTLSLEISLDENHEQSLSRLLYMYTVLSSCGETLRNCN